MVRGQWANLAMMPGLQLDSFFERHPGIFNDQRESGPRFNVSSEGRCFIQYSVPVTIWGIRTRTDHRMSAPYWCH